MQAQELLNNFNHPVNIISIRSYWYYKKKKHTRQQPFHSSLYDLHKPKLP